MKETECDRLVLDAFSLAIRVMYQAYDIDAPGTEFERPWALLREIAEGKVTLSNPADMAAKFPEFKDFLFDRANRMVEEDRAMARRILRGLELSY